MTGSKAAQKTPRKTASPETGREGLMAAAERLFAEHGVEDVSMRQIVVAAGQANHYAVQHHFGDKSGLIRAILEARLIGFDDACGRALRRAERGGELDARTLMETMLLPLAHFVDEQGRHIYAQFMLRLQHVDPSGAFATDFRAHMPANVEIVDLLRERIGHLSEADFTLRLRLASAMFLQAVAALDAPDAISGMAPNVYLKKVIDACAAVLVQGDGEAQNRDGAGARRSKSVT